MMLLLMTILEIMPILKCNMEMTTLMAMPVITLVMLETSEANGISVDFGGLEGDRTPNEDFHLEEY